MNGKTVLILGAGEFMVPAIMKARDMRYCVVAIDKNSIAPGLKFVDFFELVDIVDVNGAIKVAKKYKVDGVIPLNDFGVITAAHICEELGLIGIRPDVAGMCTDKRLMREKWHRDRVPCPEFEIVDTFASAQKAVKSIGFPVMVKPPDSMGGSRGMQKVDDVNGLEKAYQFALKHTKSRELLIEEYVIGNECSVESITYRKRTQVLAISDKTKLPPPYRVDKSVTYPSRHTLQIQTDIKTVTMKAVESLGINMSPSHLELSVTPKGMKLFEIGARTGGGGVIPTIQVQAAYVINMMGEIFKLATGCEIVQHKEVITGGSDLRFLTPKPGTVKSISGLEKALQMKGVVRGACFVKPGDIVRIVQSGGDRSGYIVTKASTREEAIRVADKAEKMIHIQTEG